MVKVGRSPLLGGPLLSTMSQIGKKVLADMTVVDDDRINIGCWLHLRRGVRGSSVR